MQNISDLEDKVMGRDRTENKKSDDVKVTQ